MKNEDLPLSGRKAGNRFRVSAHLVNAKDGFEIWADDNFEHEMRDLLDAERQLAEAVAGKLQCEPAKIESRREFGPGAMGDYARAN